jgi:hypothetical protein
MSMLLAPGKEVAREAAAEKPADDPDDAAA